MFPPKTLLDAFSAHATRLLSADSPLPRGEIEAQLKVLLQSLLGKLDLVCRDECDSQMAVLARTRSRLEALEAKLAALETSLTTPSAPE
mgnify:CR=1 FL=1